MLKLTTSSFLDMLQIYFLSGILWLQKNLNRNLHKSCDGTKFKTRLSKIMDLCLFTELCPFILVKFYFHCTVYWLTFFLCRLYMLNLKNVQLEK